VLVPALLVVALLVYWAAHGGGYATSTWEPSALAVLGLSVATAIGLGPSRTRLSRPAALALGALAAYVAWSYLSIAWAASPADALDGSNRALLFLLLFGLFALLPWRVWTALTALSAYALGIGALALVTLVRIGSGAVAGMFTDGRLTSPLGYVNGSAALFMTGAIVAVALASRRELPVAVRPPLLALGTACCQAAVLCESRGWLFSLPIVLVLAIALMPGRVRFALWALPPLIGGLAALPALLHVFERVDGAAAPAAARLALADAASHASSVALPLCGVVLLVGVALALADRRVPVPARVALGANRVAAGLAVAALLAGIAGGLVATHGRPDRKLSHYWHQSQGYQSSTPGSSRFALAGSNRPDFWRVALDATAAHPLTGLGQDNYGDYYLRRRRTDEQPRWTHSVELRLLAHTGIVGLLLFAAFLASVLVAALRGRRRAGALASAAAAAALLPLVVWFVHGSVDWLWEFPALSGPAFAFAGLAVGAIADPHDADARASTGAGRRRLLAAAGGIGVLVAALAIALPYLAEREATQATRTWRTDPAGALSRLSRASDLNPLSAQPDLLAGAIALELGRPAVAIARLDDAQQRESGNWFVPFLRGLAESDAGARDSARANFEQARTLDPREPLVALALARVGGRRPLTAAETFGSVRRDVQRLTGHS
jgi:O-Antigen ligase